MLCSRWEEPTPAFARVSTQKQARAAKTARQTGSGAGVHDPGAEVGPPYLVGIRPRLSPGETRVSGRGRLRVGRACVARRREREGDDLPGVEDDRDRELQPER